MSRLLLLLVCSLSLVGQTVRKAPVRPKLIVALMIDQFRYDYLVKFRADYHDGLARLLDEGGVHQRSS